MKTITKIILSAIVAVCSFASVKATVHPITVNYGPGFVPSSVNVTVGDTILWKWGTTGPAMSHTTTSLTIPAGATAWDTTLNSTDTVFQYVITVAGTYNYWCSFHSFSGIISASPPASINETNIPNKSFSIYPVPANDKLSVSFNNNDLKQIQLTIFNGTGQEVLEQKIENNLPEINVDITQLTSGIYFVRATTDKQTIYKQKIIITK